MFKVYRYPWMVFALILALSVLWGNTAWIFAKAKLAQYLIENSWKHTLATGEKTYPWRWADSVPVARLRFDKQEKDLYVLSGSHGTSLAFGPGHIDGSAQPNAPGTQVYSGHRDTHFRIFNELNVGDIFSVQSANGREKPYRIDRFVIVDSTQRNWWINPDIDEVHLITCYPLQGANPNPKYRIIAIAKPMATTNINAMDYSNSD